MSLSKSQEFRSWRDHHPLSQPIFSKEKVLPFVSATRTLQIPSQMNFRNMHFEIVSFSDKVGDWFRFGGQGVVCKYKLACHGNPGSHGAFVAVKFSTENNREEIRALRYIEYKQAQGTIAPVVPLIGLGIFRYEHQKTCVAMVMEYLETDLMDLLIIEKNYFTLEHVLELANKIALAISWLHRRGIAHADIKPENVMYDKLSQQIFLTDFDLAQLDVAPLQKWRLDRGGSPEPVLRTSEHFRGGTIGYMSPQRIQGKHPTMEDDAFSFGVTLIVLAGRQDTPYHGIQNRPSNTDVIDQMRLRLEGRKENPLLVSKCCFLVSRLIDSDPITRLTLPEFLIENA